MDKKYEQLHVTLCFLFKKLKDFVKVFYIFLLEMLTWLI